MRKPSYRNSVPKTIKNVYTYLHFHRQLHGKAEREGKARIIVWQIWIRGV